MKKICVWWMASPSAPKRALIDGDGTPSESNTLMIRPLDELSQMRETTFLSWGEKLKLCAAQ